MTQNDLCLRSEKQEYAWNRHNEFDTGDCVAEIEPGRVAIQADTNFWPGLAWPGLARLCEMT